MFFVLECLEIMKKLKRIQETSRGGRRQVLIRNPHIRMVCETVSRQSGVPFQMVFDDLMDMLASGYLFGLNTQDELYRRALNRLSE